MDNYREVKGRIHSTETFGAVDGPGIRFIVFFQGCPLRCLYCHNPDSWKFDEGEQITAGELIDTIKKYKNYIKGGVTFSGGECLAQPEFCHALLKLCKAEGLHVALDTSGIIPISKVKDIIDDADMLLLDIKDIDDEDCKILTGMSNKNALEMLDYCESTGKPVWIRQVCLPEYTMKQDKMERLASHIREYKCVEKVELMPFHQMGIYKWDYIDTEYKLGDIEPPTEQEIDKIRELFV